MQHESIDKSKEILSGITKGPLYTSPHAGVLGRALWVFAKGGAQFSPLTVKSQGDLKKAIAKVILAARRCLKKYKTLPREFLSALDSPGLRGSLCSEAEHLHSQGKTDADEDFLLLASPQPADLELLLSGNKVHKVRVLDIVRFAVLHHVMATQYYSFRMPAIRATTVSQIADVTSKITWKFVRCCPAIFNKDAMELLRSVLRTDQPDFFYYNDVAVPPVVGIRDEA